jgi:CDP-diacylglycerol--glycerol-3-phosphate 3-phosphatidyltransferase
MTEASVPTALRRRWWLAAAVGLLSVTAVAVVAARTLSVTAAVLWSLITLVPLGYTLWLLRRSLSLNRPPESADTMAAVPDGGTTVFPMLGVANGVTIGRGWLYAGVAGFLLVTPPVDSVWRWLPALWYGGGAALDWVDGLVARRVGRPTRLGERLDLAFDTMGFLVAPVVAVAWGALPVWYLAVSAARYCYRFGCWLHERRGGTVGGLPESHLRRPLAGLQMAVVALALLPVVPASVAWPAATFAMLPSLAVFVRDYLVVTGRLGVPNARDAPNTS